MSRILLFAIAMVAPFVGAQSVIINEFLADNTSTSLQDEDQDTPDWIELKNTLGTPVSLNGWYLTDDVGDLTKWRLPDVSVPGNGYLVLFASGKDRTPTDGDPLHTNFVLAQNGEYLALVAPNGTVVSEYGENGTDYPNQRAGISYGVYGTPETVGFMFDPTPGEENDDRTAVEGFVADTEFDMDRGFYDRPFQVTITSKTPGAIIRFTTDGSWPTERFGRIYRAPIRIARTTTLKAIAYKPGHTPSNVDTQTYIFVTDVVQQTASNTQNLYGLPSRWGNQTPYYGMNGNPRINPLTHRSLRADLKTVPSLVISMDQRDLFSSSGIYANPQQSGELWERQTSLEFIDPNSDDEFQQNCAIRIQGGAFRSFGLTRKKSFRVLFKSDWGPSNLPTGGPGKLDYPLFGPDAAQSFQSLIFRMESNDGWQWGGAGSQPQYARDEFGRRAQRALGQPAPHGRYCHLYINGVYWGVYNLVERPDSGFAESYFGATRERWQGQNSGRPINDAIDLRDWNSMNSTVRRISGAAAAADREYLRSCGFNEDGTRNPIYRVWVDPSNIADYLIVNWYGGNSDWPHKNYYSGWARDPDTTGWKYFMWDSEWSMFMRSDLWTNRTTNYSGVAQPQQYLERSPEYRVRFGDRAHTALFNDGVFTPERAHALYDEITKDHRSILNAEAARWGNQHGGAHTVSSWESEYRRITNSNSGWFANRGDNFLSQLRGRRLYPNIEAPTYSQHGGTVVTGSGPTLTVPGTVTKVYYMYGSGDGDLTDYGHSLDPRLVGGEPNSAATLIEFTRSARPNVSAPIPLFGPGYLFSRSYNSVTREWSALNKAFFTVDTVPADASNLVISELHYHPASPSEEEVAAGYEDQDDFEFFEVQNIGSRKLDLTDVDFINGIDFAFPAGFSLEIGGKAVVVKNLAAFRERYPDPEINVAGEFLDGSGLRNSGERIEMRAADGTTIRNFSYNDKSPWPTDADGMTGVSLVLITPTSNPDHSLPQSWRGSAMVGGTPDGEHDARLFSGEPNADQDGDGLAAYLEHALGTSDTDARDRSYLKIRRQSLELEGDTATYLVFSLVKDQLAEDVVISPQLSNDMSSWSAEGVVLVSEESLGGTTSLVTWRSAEPVTAQVQLYARVLVTARQ